MNLMFEWCLSLTWLDLSNFNTENVTEMQEMFLNCRSLKTIYCNDTWTCQKASGMFFYCFSLVGAAEFNENLFDISMANPETGYFTSCSLEKEAYAINDGSALTFYYDKIRASRTGTAYTALDKHEWTNSNITNAIFRISFKKYLPTSTAYWFKDCKKLETIEGIKNLNTDEVTDMSYMFWNCNSLTSLNLSNFKTDNVTNMLGMFYYCTSLTSLDLSSFNTENVTIMDGMFHHCISLKSLNVSSFNTEKVTDIHNMFLYCQSLTSLDVTNFNTSNATNMSYMFSYCTNLTSLDLSSFNTEKVTDMSYMFWGSKSLSSLDLSSFNTEKVTDMSCMFDGCSALTELDLSNFNTEKVTDMSCMFYNCNSLTSLDVTGFITDNVTDMGGMFVGCESLTELDVSKFNTSNVTDMSYMFYNSNSLTTIYCNDTWTCDKSTDMFYGCTSLVGAVAYDANYVDVTMANPETGYFTEEGSSSISQINTDNGNRVTGIYNLLGIKMQDDFESLPAGIYIVNGKKVIKR
ncbi:MAG: BspA family leucine-rich repeat surface protein [Muribaculaceae bacterium]